MHFSFLFQQYFVALLLIFILEIAAGIFAYVKKDEVYKEIRKNLKKAVEKSYSESTSASEADKAFTKAVNTIQVQVRFILIISFFISG